MQPSRNHSSLWARTALMAVLGTVGLACVEPHCLGVQLLDRAAAQVVQLPSVQNFSYSGGASVPDHGDATLGGYRTRRGSSNTSGAGPLAGRSVGSQAGSGSLSVSATIIDLQAMDEAILNQPADTPPTAASNYAVRSTGTPIMNTLTPHLYAQRTTRDSVPGSDPNAWQIALGTPPAKPDVGRVSARNDSAARYYMLKSKEASAVGRNAAARVYYQLAYDQLTPEQRTRLQNIQRRVNEEARQATAGNEAGSTATEAVAGSAAGNTTAPPSAATSASTSSAAIGGASSPAFPMEDSALDSDAGAPQAETSTADPFASPF